MSKVKAVFSKQLSASGDKRYVIVDSQTGEILDDAQGYGFKTPRGAYAAWGYKNQGKEKRKENRIKDDLLKKWFQENSSFIHKLEEELFRVTAGKYGPDEKFNAAFVTQLAKECQVELPVSPGYFIKYFLKN